MVAFELEVLKNSSYGLLMEFNTNLAYLLTLQLDIKVSAEEREDVEVIFKTTNMIKVIKSNQKLVNEALDYKEREVSIECDILPVFLN